MYLYKDSFNISLYEVYERVRILILGNKPKRFIYPSYHIPYKNMITKKAGSEEGIYKTLLKAAKVKARQERRDNRLSFLGEGGKGRGGLTLPTL